MFLYFGAVLFAAFLLLGCTKSIGIKIKNKDENTQTIEAVLNNNLTGPDDELIRIFNDMSEDSIEAQIKYEENLYKEYFADDAAFQEFVSYYGTTLLIGPIKNNYKLKVKNIEFEKTESKEIIYNFKVEVEYKKEGSDKSEIGILDGQANLNEEHKIELIRIRVKEFWSTFDN